jgi:hypothetical protein
MLERQAVTSDAPEAIQVDTGGFNSIGKGFSKGL